MGPLIGGPIGAAAHYFPLEWGEKDDDEARAVNIAGDEQRPEGVVEVDENGAASDAPNNNENTV